MAGLRREERYTQVRASLRDGQYSHGSGFLLGDGVILTARHVIQPKDHESPIAIEVRGAKEAGWTPAELIWPVLDDLASGPWDVAIVKRVDLAGDVTSTPFGLDDDTDDLTPELPVFSTGFPQFKGEPRDTHQIKAMMMRDTGIKTQSYELNNVNHNLGERGARENADDWHGFSGSPLFYARRLIGIVMRVSNRGRIDFRAVRIDPLLALPDFREKLPPGMSLAGVPAQMEVPTVSDLIYLLDRDPQESEFIFAHRGCCGLQARSPALLCALPGAHDARHLPYEFKTRLERKTLHALDWPTGPIQFSPLIWPRRGTVEERLAMLREELWQKICGEGPAPADSGSYAALLRDASRPRTVYSELRDTSLDAEACATLSCWAGFLSLIDSGVNRPLVHLLLVRADFARTQEWLGTATPTANARIHLLTELEMCTVIELQEWFDTKLPAAARRILAAMRGEIVGRYQQDFYASELKSDLDALMRRRAGG